MFTSFLPAMSTQAIKAKSDELRAMRIHHRTTWTLDDLAAWLNPKVAGWMQYYGRFYRSAMYPLLIRVSTYLRRWAGRSTGDCGPSAGSSDGGRDCSIGSPSLRPLAMGPLGRATRLMRRAR